MTDEVPGAGPLGGIYTAIVRSPRERTLVVACDMPFLSGALLRTLAAVKDADVGHSATREKATSRCARFIRAPAPTISATAGARDRRSIEASGRSARDGIRRGRRDVCS